MELWQSEDYKQYVLARLETLPKRGHGQFKRMAEHLRVSTVYITQVFRQNKHLSPEQAFALCDLLGFSNLEREYFLALVQLGRAGTEDLRRYLKERLSRLRDKAQNLKTRIAKQAEISEQAKATFYSNWTYSAFRLATAIEHFQTAENLADRFQLPLKTANQVIEFLIEHGLCVREQGYIKRGPQVTHLEAGSPYIQARQIQWRAKGFESMNRVRPDELFYTGPMVLAARDIPEVRRKLVALIEEVTQLVRDSKDEELACLNIDWFRF